MKHKFERGFSNNMGAIFAAAGGAVGLGNIWRFPYVVGQNGGAAFLLVYVLFVVLLGVPIMMSEVIIGRRSQQNLVGAFHTLAPHHKLWRNLGILGLVTAIIIYSYYSVVAGWTLNYIVLSCDGQLMGKNPAEITQIFNSFTQNSFWPILYQFIFIGITALVIIMGVKNGIEKSTKVLMPLLLLLLIFMCIRSLSLTGAEKGVNFLFKADFSKLTAESYLYALGQALFSLSIGMGALITYGSYIRKEDNLFTTCIWISGADTLVAILSGVAIFPAVFAFGLSPTSGPSLVYEVLPNVFNSMHFGQIFAICFFILLAIAALTSTISLLEVVVLWEIEELKWSRKKAAIISSLCIFLIGISCSLSFGVLQNVTIFNFTIFGLFDRISSIYLMPIGALLFTIFLGWYHPKAEVYDELSNSGKLKIKYFDFFYFILRYIAPLALLTIFITNIFLD